MTTAHNVFRVSESAEPIRNAIPAGTNSSWVTMSVSLHGAVTRIASRSPLRSLAMSSGCVASSTYNGRSAAISFSSGMNCGNK